MVDHSAASHETMTVMSAGPVEQEPFQRVRALLGDKLVRYLLALDPDAPLDADALSGGGRVGSAQFLIELVTTPGLISDDEHARAFDLPRILGCRVPPPEGPTFANLLRVQSGGDVPVAPRTLDPIAQAIASALPDAYAMLLIPEGRHFGIGPSLSGVTYPNEALRLAVHKAVKGDVELSSLFSDQDDTGPVGASARSTGQGSGIQLITLPMQQITMAWERALLANEDPTLEEIADAMCANLDAIRTAIRKQPTTIPAIVGLTGVLLPNEADVLDVGWGRIRPATDREQTRASAFGGGGQVANTLPSGETVVIEYAGDLVLQADSPYAVRLGMIRDEQPWPAELQVAQTQATEWLESLQLGLALAVDDVDEPMTVVPAWQVFLDPLGSPGNRSGWDTKQATGIIPRRLTPAQAEAWRTWSQAVHRHRTPEVAVAIRRMLMAMTERRRPEDMLVDAVIVWENLFGAPNETTLRVSAALAWLLAGDAPGRRSLYSELAVLYKLRSGVVHGNRKQTNPQDLGLKARRAVQIALSALRTVFSIRSDLLKEKDPAQRALTLILAG
jgi:hypothetical protein